MKYQYGNYPLEIKHESIEESPIIDNFIEIEESPIIDNFIEIEESPIIDNFIEIEEILIIDNFIEIEEALLEPKEKSKPVEKEINNEKEQFKDSEYQYTPRTIKDWDEGKPFKPEFEEVNTKQINQRNDQEYEEYIPKSIQQYEDYTPKSIQEYEDYTPKTIKNLDEKKPFKPEFKEINNQEYEDYIPKSIQEYEDYIPRTTDEGKNFLPETQKIKILYED